MFDSLNARLDMRIMERVAGGGGGGGKGHVSLN